MKIALVTYLQKPQGTLDDQLLFQRLVEQGQHVEFAVWSDQNIQWSSYDFVILRSTWDYYFNIKDFLNWLKKIELETKIINSAETVIWNSSKEYLLELEKNNLPIVPTLVAKNEAQGIRLAEKLFGSHSEIVIKPAISASADLTFRIKSQEEVKSVLSKSLHRGPVLLQPFISSVVSEGEISLVFFGSKGNFQYSHSILKVPQKGDFRVQSDFGGQVKSFAPPNDLIDFAFKIIKFIPGDFNFLRVDIVNWKTQPQIGELELIEPDLFFRHASDAAVLFATHLKNESEFQSIY